MGYLFGRRRPELIAKTSLGSFPDYVGKKGDSSNGPIPFKFENMWVKAEGFKDLIEGWRKSAEVSRMGSFILMQKLKILRTILKGGTKRCLGEFKIEKGLP